MEASKKGKPINQGKDFAYRGFRARLPPNMELICGGGGGGGGLWWWWFVAVVVCGGGI